jgi:hypothetical protein
VTVPHGATVAGMVNTINQGVILMKSKLFALVLIAAGAAFSQSIVLVSPNGGENVDAGQRVVIRWTEDYQFPFVEGFYSFDNGASWTSCGSSPTGADSIPWIVPYTKLGSDRALIKITAASGPIVGFSAFDVSDGNFTVKPAVPDAYEPNDDFASAYPIAVGDSVVKNAFVFNYPDPETPAIDEDYFKVALTAGMTVTITTRHSYIEEPQGSGAIADIALYDSSKTSVASDYSKLTYAVAQSGVYFCKIFTSKEKSYLKYHLTIRQGGCDIALLSPNGGESFSGGQTVTINWTQGGGIFGINVQYSCDNGSTWEPIANLVDKGPVSWIVPYLKNPATSVKVKVIANVNYLHNPALDTIYDISDGTFAIRAAHPDAYEPNDDFSSASPITIGDSVVQNATVFADHDLATTNPFLEDRDYFKVSLTGGKVVTLSAFDYGYTESAIPLIGEGVAPLIGIQLYDSSFNRLGGGIQPVECNITRSGVYYCQIYVYSRGGIKYGLSIYQTDGGIRLVSPVGGESFASGQKVAIRWTKDACIGAVEALFSCDSGETWRGITRTDSTSFTWTVPHKRRQVDHVLVKVIPYTIVNPPGIVSGSFTILASPPDAYEPNNDFASAYSIALGDSAVAGAIVMGGDSIFKNMIPVGIDTSTIDEDFFKIALTAGKLTTFSAVAISRPLSAPGYEYRNSPTVALFDVLQQRVAISSGSLRYTAEKSGNYYCRISANIDEWYKYNLSIKEAVILSAQTFSIDTSAFETAGDAYTTQLLADTTKVSIGLTLRQKTPGAVRTMVLFADDLAPVPDMKENVKVISILADSAISSSLKTAEFTISYNAANLNGYSENSLIMLRFNDSTNQWTQLACTVDTVNHQVSATSNALNIFGIFIPSNTAVRPSAPQHAHTFGIKANYSSQKQSIAVHFTFPQATNADLRLYNIQGKCVKKYASKVALGNSTLMWNLCGLANGKYFLNMKAGTYSVKQAILIMN